MGLFDFMKPNKKTAKPTAMPPQAARPTDAPQADAGKISTTPESPLPFGYKTCWLAVKNTTPQKVMEALSLKDTAVANWESGLQFSYEYDGDPSDGDHVFVTPVLDGYVLAIGLWDLTLEQLEPIAQKFDEVQYFMSHGVVDVQSWTMFREGKLVRRYFYIGESGEVESSGELTPQERELGLDNLLMSEDPDWDEVEFPDEEHVLAVAAAWGVDPRMESHSGETSTGFIGVKL